ncbi:hypothetical protein [Fictibacillus sp. S7]|uniref:hypothetical protein n=1 Tax=Fictibacillus sp. S7 TaxID=2212476 RepID=UPI0013E98B85|nr:hypothetical protein [Fictibacillus sp. S7]
MNKSLTQFTQQESMQGQGIHVFYYSDKVEDYIQNAVSYIMAGIEQGEYIGVHTVSGKRTHFSNDSKGIGKNFNTKADRERAFH